MLLWWSKFLSLVRPSTGQVRQIERSRTPWEYESAICVLDRVLFNLAESFDSAYSVRLSDSRANSKGKNKPGSLWTFLLNASDFTRTELS